MNRRDLLKVVPLATVATVVPAAQAKSLQGENTIEHCDGYSVAKKVITIQFTQGNAKIKCCGDEFLVKMGDSLCLTHTVRIYNPTNMPIELSNW